MLTAFRSKTKMCSRKTIKNPVYIGFSDNTYRTLFVDDNIFKSNSRMIFNILLIFEIQNKRTIKLFAKRCSVFFQYVE